MANHGPEKVFRLLVIEDDTGRVEMLRHWLPEKIKLVVAPSTGAALVILNGDTGNEYAGIMLDHDVRQGPLVSMDKALSGTYVVQRIIDTVSPNVPILIHSTDSAGSAYVAAILRNAGFEVRRIPIHKVDREKFTEWVEEAYALWEDTF